MSGPNGEVMSQGTDTGDWHSSPRWGVLLSIAGPIAWLCFTLLYVAFWATGFTLFQSVVVILVSLLVLIGILATAWTAWGMRRRTWRFS
ncbi:MAG TPA: hypothetical protein VEY07_02205 [Thermoplasmata archaeon]|nr:hypothetical protein [Thermoplasmata archaeon]